MSAARATGALLLAALLLIGLAGVARAHASFLRSEPPANSVLETAPERLQLWFTEPLEAGFSDVQVLDSGRRRVDLGDSRVLPDDQTSMVVSLQALEKRTYTVAWKALSTVDGHVTRGVFSISIGVEPPSEVASPPPPEASPELPYETATRWSGYLAAAALVGALLFRLLVLQPEAERQGLAAAVLLATAAPRGHLLWAAWATLLAATLATLALQVSLVGGSGSSAALGGITGQLLFGTRYGVVWLARLSLVLGMGALLIWMGRREQRSILWLGAGLGGGVLLTYSLNSHSAAAGGLTALAVAADWLHLLAVAAWVGGLFSLALVLPSGLQPLEPAARWRLLAGLIPRFSALATISVGALLATGLYQAWLHVGSFDALLQTLYGKSLLAKLSLVAPLLLFGAVNLLVISPRLNAAVARTSYASAPLARGLAQGARLGGRFTRLVLAEAVLAALALLAAGVLTSLPPGRQTFDQMQATRPLVLSSQAQDLRLSLSIAPARPGSNTFTISVRGLEGQPVDDAERVDLRFSYLEEALGESVEIAEPQGDGRYVARGAFISVEGRWQVELLVRRPGLEDARTAFRLLVTSTSAEEEQPGAAPGPAPRLPVPSIISLMALGLALLGAVLVIYVARTVGLRSLEGSALAFATLAVISLSVFLAFRAQAASPVAPGDIRSMRNPFPPTQESLAIGEGIYRTAQCHVCHGVNGRGDGPAAPALNPRPADFRVHMAAGHTDGELFYWVSDGVKGTAMPAFKDQLPEEERWHAINFIKTFARSER